MPLTGIRVLDLGSMVAAPLGATLLGDMGAEVIKIEPPGGEEGRRIGPRRGDDTGLYVGVNRNKRGLVLDLDLPQGQEALRRLLADTDIVIHNLRNPARERLRPTAALCSIRPDIISTTACRNRFSTSSTVHSRFLVSRYAWLAHQAPCAVHPRHLGNTAPRSCASWGMRRTLSRSWRWPGCWWVMVGRLVWLTTRPRG